MTLQAGSVFNIAISSGTTGVAYDQVNVTGIATINNATLNLIAASSVPAGNIVILTASGGVTGTFAGLPQDSTIISGGQPYQINYNSNSVVLSLQINEYVSSTWVNDAPGTVVTDPVLTNGTTAIIGVNAFATVSAAITAEPQEGPAIIVNPGVYSESVSAGQEPITLYLQGGAISFNSITDSAADPLSIVLASNSVTCNVVGGILNGVISGPGNLAVSGPGSLILLGADTYSGSSTINPGATLQIGNGGIAGQPQGNLLYDNGPVNGTLGAYTISAHSLYTVSDSFTLAGTRA